MKKKTQLNEFTRERERERERERDRLQRWSEGGRDKWLVRHPVLLVRTFSQCFFHDAPTPFIFSEACAGLLVQHLTSPTWLSWLRIALWLRMTCKPCSRISGHHRLVLQRSSTLQHRIHLSPLYGLPSLAA